MISKLQPGDRVTVGPYWVTEVSDIRANVTIELNATIEGPGDNQFLVDNLCEQWPDYVLRFESTIRDERCWLVRLDDGAKAYVMESQLTPEGCTWTELFLNERWNYQL